MNAPAGPVRGEIWDLDLDPIKGREQAGRRSALVISVNSFNDGPAELLVVVPITRTDRRVRWHVPVKPPEGGLSQVSFIKCEDVRSVSKSRLFRFRGRVSQVTLAAVEDRLRILMGL